MTDLALAQNNAMPAMPSTSAMSAEAQRAIAETQGALIVAQSRPRDMNATLQRINAACDQLSVAESAEYTYNRGGKLVRGPSIRLAEVLAQSYGNFQSGVRELSRTVDHRTGIGTSEVEAFAWDLETNTRDSKIFQVEHVRHTKAGAKTLTDSRDIYELVANNASRRKRACIQAVIPQWIQDAAVDRCRETLTAKIKINQETVKGMAASFHDVGVTREQIETFLGHKLTVSELTRDEYLNLRGIYQSIRDGMQKPGDFFESDGAPDAPVADDDLNAALSGMVAEPEQDIDYDALASQLVDRAETVETITELGKIAVEAEPLKSKRALYDLVRSAVEARHKELHGKKG